MLIRIVPSTVGVTKSTSLTADTTASIVDTSLKYFMVN